MSCPTLISPACMIADKAAELGGGAQHQLVHSSLELVSKQISDAVAWLVRTTVTWWVSVPTVDVTHQPVIDDLRSWFLPIALAVTVAGLIAAGARMAATRKANPLIDVTGGLMVIATVGALGVSAPSLLLKIGDVWSTWVLDRSTGHAFAQRMADVLSMHAISPGFVLVFGTIALLMAAVQAILMLLRETAILILIGLLPLAAAGAMSPAMRGWIKRVVAWLLALIVYKPAAAAVYAMAFALIGKGNGLRVILMGFCALLLSLIALPVLIKFFTFATGSVGQSAGGGILGAAMGATVAAGSLRTAGGGSASGQAAYTSSRMPPPGGGGSAGGPDGGQAPSSGGTPAGATRSGGAGDSEQAKPGRRGSGGTTTGSATSGGTEAAASGARSATAAGASTGGGASAGGAAAGSAATGAASAGGPAGMAVAASVEAGKKAADGARNAAGSAMTPDGSEQS